MESLARIVSLIVFAATFCGTTPTFAAVAVRAPSESTHQVVVSFAIFVFCTLLLTGYEALATWRRKSRSARFPQVPSNRLPIGHTVTAKAA